MYFSNSTNAEQSTDKQSPTSCPFFLLHCRAMLAAALGKQLQQRDSGAAAAVRRGVSASARNAAVTAEAYPESEAHAATTAAGERVRAKQLLWGNYSPR